MRKLLAWGLLVLGLSCAGGARATELLFSASAEHPFLSPFPDQRLVKADGGIDLSGLKPGKKGGLLNQAIEVVSVDNGGYPLRPKIYFPLSGPVSSEGIPKSINESLSPDSGVYLLGVQPGTPDYGVPYPIRASMLVNPVKGGAPFYLALSLYPGVVLRPGAWYGAFVLDRVKDTHGESLTSALPFVQAFANTKKAGELGFGFSLLQQTLAEKKVPLSAVKGATVFQTGDPLKESFQLAEHVRSLTNITLANIKKAKDLPHSCLIEAEIKTPVFISAKEGRMLFKLNGSPARQGAVTRRLLFSVPRQITPSPGFGAVLLDAPDAARELARESTRLKAIWAQGLIPVTLAPPKKKPAKAKSLWALRDAVRQDVAGHLAVVNALNGVRFDPSLCPETRYPIKINPALLSLWTENEGRAAGELFLSVQKGVQAALVSGDVPDWFVMIRQWAGLKDKPLTPLLEDPEMHEETAKSLDHPYLELFRMAETKIARLPTSRYWNVRPHYSRGPKSVVLFAASFEDVDLAIASGMDHSPLGDAPEQALLRLTGLGSQRIGFPAKGNRQTPIGPVTSQAILIPKGISPRQDPLLRQAACFLGQAGMVQAPEVLPPVGSWKDGCVWKPPKKKTEPEKKPEKPSKKVQKTSKKDTKTTKKPRKK